MVNEGMFKGWGSIVVVGVTITALMVLIILGVLDVFAMKDNYKSKNLLKPDVVITTDSTHKADTTYIYHFNN